MPHLGFGDRTAELEANLAPWPTPSIAPVAGTWLGALDASLAFPLRMVGPDGEPMDPFAGVTLRDVVDAYLYLGRLENLSAVVESPFIVRDDAYFQELRRRHDLMGQPLDEERPHYVRYGVPARTLDAPPPVADGDPEAGPRRPRIAG